ncbi:histidine phosphatase family protein [Flaviflexus massiliensis]|uniref:histidine phosphatase family protein n=1 Tax=Flaviflexus massiliensis TaxID=1522309 RepID=UPI0009E77449|nr:histidine phosphatase family protein [Flaviflexus massiliensis]
MITRMIFWRHGQTDLNKQRRLQGSSDYPLNDTGREQAKAAAPKIAALKPDFIIASNLARAYDTAQALAAETGLDIIVDPRIQERTFGAWEGQNLEEIAVHSAERLQLWRDGKEPGGDVESRQDCGIRVANAVQDWTEKLHDEEGETVVFVSHGAAISNAIMTMLGVNPSEQQPLGGMDNCHWAIMSRQQNREPIWRLNSYNVN